MITRKKLEDAQNYFDRHGMLIRDDGLLIGGDHHNFEQIPDDLNETLNRMFELLLNKDVVLVPVEPTQAMELSGKHFIKGSVDGMFERQQAIGCYKVMISASPFKIEE